MTEGRRHMADTALRIPRAASTPDAGIDDRTLTDDYRSWLDANLSRLEDLLASVSAGAGDPAALAFRANAIFHDIKGNGATFGYDLAAAIGRSGCRLFGCQDGSGGAGIEALHAHVSALRLVVDRHIVGSGGAAGERLLRRLHAMNAASLAGSATCDRDAGAQHFVPAFHRWAANALQQLGQITAPGESSQATGAGLSAADNLLHDLAGSSGHFGYELMARIAQSASALLREHPEIDDRQRAALHQHVEAMQLIVGRRIAGDGGESGRRLLARLAELSAGCRRAPGSPG